MGLDLRDHFVSAHGPRDFYEHAELMRLDRLEEDRDTTRNPILIADRHKQDRKREQEDSSADVAYAVLELDQQVAALHAQIDEDTARLTALIMENERELAAARDGVDRALKQAVTLSDGRRAYLDTETQIFVDEQGQALGDDDLIDARFPEDGTVTTYVQFVAARDRLAAAEAERKALQDLQKDYDDLKDRADLDDLTADDVKDIEADRERLYTQLDEIEAGHVDQAHDQTVNAPDAHHQAETVSAFEANTFS